MTRFALPVIAFFGLVIVFYFGLGNDPGKLPSPFIGKPAPSFDLPQLHELSERVTNQSITGNKVLVNFWATWCVGCRQEHDFLMQLAANDVIPIYGINWRDNRQLAIEWLAQLGDPYVTSGYDGENRTGIDWGVYGAPETFLLAEDGTVLYKHLGPLDAATWQRVFVPLLQNEDGES